jgi:hypothetical protein
VNERNEGEIALGRRQCARRGTGRGRADGAEAGLAEGAARLDARPGHDAEEAEVVRAAVELAADGLPRFREADTARPVLRRVHPGLALGRRRRGSATAVERGGHVVRWRLAMGSVGRVVRSRAEKNWRSGACWGLLRRRLYLSSHVGEGALDSTRNCVGLGLGPRAAKVLGRILLPYTEFGFRINVEHQILKYLIFM